MNTHPTAPRPPFLGEGLSRAFNLARRLHDGQPRKGTAIPYLAHPMAVCALALGFGATEDQAIAALLHDTAEDGGGEGILKDIAANFGAPVAAIVRACSDSLTVDSTQKAPWRPRKEAYLAHLATADRSVRLVAAADKLHNMTCTVDDLRTQGPAFWARFKTGPAEQSWFYGECVRILTAEDAEPWSEPLRRAFADLQGSLSGPSPSR